LYAEHKTGATWRGGDAVHLVLWQHRVNTPLALWFAAHEPAWLSPLLTRLTRRTELLLPFLLLWPTHALVTRGTAFLLAVLLHGGIALCLTLGPFSYAMICLVWLAVPGAALDLAARQLPRRFGSRWLRIQARAVRAVRRRFYVTKSRPAVSSAAPERWRLARELAIGCILLVEGANIAVSNDAVPAWLQFREPAWLLAYKPYLRAYQRWAMFAPDAPREDGTIVVDAQTVSGRHIDPFTGAPPDFEQIRRGLAPHSIALSDYLLSMQSARNSRYRRDLGRYLKAYRVAGTNERLRLAEVWWVSYTPPPRGRYEPGPIKKEKLWRQKM